MKIAFNPSTVAALITPPNNKDITFDLRGRNIFARGVKFCGTDTWRDIKINNVSIDSNTLDLRNGSNTTLTNTNGVVTINSTWRPVVDNLTSDSTTSSLSAKQGKVLKALIDGKSNSGHTHDDRYVKKTGDTMSGVLTIDTTNFGALTIKGNDDDNGASIQFRGKSSVYGYIGLNNSTKDKQFLRWGSDTSKTYTILDTSSTYTSNGKGVINGTTITQVSNADTTDGVHLEWSGQLTYDQYSWLAGWTNDGKKIKAVNKSQFATSGHTHDDRYLKLSGGTMTGSIAFSNSSYLLWNNGSYHQRIFLTDDSTADTAVFTFQQSSDSGTNWNNLMTIRDNGKIIANTFVGALQGNASTASKLTSSAGNASLPIYFSDGKPVACTASQIFSNLSNSGNNLSITVAGQNRTLTVAYASVTSKINSRGNLTAYEEGSTIKGESGVNFYTVYNNGYPVTFGNLLHINGSGAGQLLAEWCGSSTLGHLYYRSKRDNSDNGWSVWGKVAFVTDNVTSATKLQTVRTLWGQSFNGTSNVSGSLSNTGTITASSAATYDIGSNTLDYRYGYFQWIGAKSNTNLRLAANNSDNQIVLHTNGNVGIGTASPAYKLHVNGTLGVNNIATFNINNSWLSPSVLQIGRLNDSKDASKAIIGVTNGNLHIDAYHNKELYLNYYNKGKIKFGYQTGAYYISENGSYYSGTAASANNASTATKLQTARNIALGTDLRGSANFDGSNNITISANINACTVGVSSTNGLPFKRIAHFETGSSWNDNALLLYISQGYINGSNGICRVEFRTDNISSSSTSVTASAAVRWLVRNGYGLDSLYAGYYVTTSKAYIDIYLKTTGGYQGTVIRVLQDSRGGINSNVQLINSYYYSDTNHKEAYNSIEAASTALYNRAYTRIVSGSDVGTVSYSNSTGSVHWNNVTNKPSTFAPAAHTHTVFKNNLMIKGTNGVSDSASIHLGIGDSDTGFKWISDGKCQIYANNVAVGEWTQNGMNWFKNPTVNGNKIWNAGNDGSGSGLDADLLDGWHLDSIRKNVGYSWSAKYRINNWSRIIKIDNYSNILLAINFSQNSQASNHLYLISTGYGCGNIVQLGANGYNGNSAIKIRLTENTAISHNVEIYSTYGYNGATELSINCNYTRIDGNSTITTYLTYTAGGGTVRKEITSSYSKIVANLQGNSDTTTKLQTPRQINGTNFDGSANITTSYWGTTRTLTIGNSGKSVNGSANISWSLSEIGAASSSHSHNYAANENYGGFTKSGRLPISGFYQSNESESGGNAPWSGWIHLINCQHSNTGNNYALQIAASFGNNNTFKIRVTNNNVNNAWRDIIHSGNIGSQLVKGAYMTPLTLNIEKLISSGYLANDYTNRYDTQEYMKATAKYLQKNYPGYSVFGTIYPNGRGFFTANIYGDGFNSNGNPEHITIHYYPHGGNIINCGTAYGSWYYSKINRDGSSYKLQTARKIWGQSFDGTADISGTLSGVAHIQFSADKAYDIGSNSAASRYIYTYWLGAKSGQKLELGANNSGYGQGLCIDTNLNVGIGTNTPAYKLHVDGDIYTTTGFKKNGSSDSYVLLGGGGHKAESSLRVAYATSAQYLRSLGNQNCQTGRTQDYGDVYTYNTYDGNTGSPTTYTSVIGFGRGIAGTVEIAGGWDNTNLYWRSLRDCCEDWHSWRTVLDSSNYTEFINNYYWANVKISTSSSTTTSPTVSNLTATSSIKMGNILLGYTDEINNSANGSIHLNYRNSGNVSLCQGGGSVGIGTTSPTYKLDVNGQIKASGFHHSSMNSDNYILLAGGGYSQGVPVKYWSIESISIYGPTQVFRVNRGGNYTFVTKVEPRIKGSCVLTLQFPSGYYYENTIIWARGVLNLDISDSSNSTIYATIFQFSDSKYYLNLSDDDSLNNGTCQLYFMCF